MRSKIEANASNIYQLDGAVPLGKAISFGLQHILAMFVANLSPITLIPECPTALRDFYTHGFEFYIL